MSEQLESVVSVKEMDTSELSPLHRDANRRLFISWVNSNLRERFGLDVLGSVMLYDAEKYFLCAMHELPDEGAMRRMRVGTRIRYYSNGI